MHPRLSALSSHPACIPLLRLKLTDLQTLSALAAESLGIDGGPGNAADLEARIRRQFRFLPRLDRRHPPVAHHHVIWRSNSTA